MVHPFFNAKALSDEELIRKQQELTRRVYEAYAVGFSYDIVTQLQLLLESIELEREERDAKTIFDLINQQFPEVIESDKEWLSDEEKARATRVTNINDTYVPDTLKKETKPERLNGRQEQFKRWQEQQRKNPNSNESVTERLPEGTPPQPKRRGRPKKTKTP
jgi:hypothetical protein